MLVIAGQLAVTSVQEKNAEVYASLMTQAAEDSAPLLTLSKASLVRDDHDVGLSAKPAQPLEGGFLGLYDEKVNAA